MNDVLFIGSFGDYKPNTKHQMSAEIFCCRLHLKRGQARLGSPLFKLKQQPKTQAYLYVVFTIWFLVIADPMK